jgi:hypothetical protein
MIRIHTSSAYLGMAAYAAPTGVIEGEMEACIYSLLIDRHVGNLCSCYRAAIVLLGGWRQHVEGMRASRPWLVRPACRHRTYYHACEIMLQ